MYCQITRPDGKAKMDEIKALFIIRTNKRRTIVAVEWRANILEVFRVAGLLTSVTS